MQRVEACWVDSYHRNRWMSYEDTKTIEWEPAKCYTCGYLFIQEENYICIAQSLSPEEISDIMIIPTVNLIKLYFFGEGGEDFGESYIVRQKESPHPGVQTTWQTAQDLRSGD